MKYTAEQIRDRIHNELDKTIAKSLQDFDKKKIRKILLNMPSNDIFIKIVVLTSEKINATVKKPSLRLVKNDS